MTAVQWERVDTHRALDLLEKAVAERGERYVYLDDHDDDVCHYTDSTGEPACIVGLALALHGVPLPVLVDAGTQPIKPWSQLAFAVDVTPDAARVLDAAQTTQDKGRPWGEALANARGVAATLAKQAHAQAVSA